MQASTSATRILFVAALVSVLTLFFKVSLTAQTSAPSAPPSTSIVEKGKFKLHKFEQPIGEETYTITSDGESLAVKIDFKFTDRGTEVPLSASFRSKSDLTPQAFTVKGNNSRITTIDEEVQLQPDKARIRSRDHWTDAAVPTSPFFTIAGFAPATMQMLMVRYWARHGSPARLPTLPSGTVRVEPRGKDAIAVNGKTEKLDRYSVEGLIWGRETLWFDGRRNLVAAVTTDAEFDHFEALREGYENALGDFVGRAGTDGMAALATLSRGISGSRAKTLVVEGALLIDGTGRAPIPDSAVVMRGGRIIAVGPRSQIKIPMHATIVDANGKTILPGLWDMHAHFEQVEWGPIYLAAGVTTVRDCGNELEFITAVRDAITAGRGLGPRLLLAGIVDGTGKLALGVQRVDTPEQAREWTDRYHDAGFQQMKVYSSVKLEQVRAIADEAHRLGMTVTGHVPEGLTAYQVIEAGQDQINHIQYILDIMHAPLPPDTPMPERRKALTDIDLDSPEAKKAISFLQAHHSVVDPTMALMEFFTATTAKPPASFEPGVNKVAPELAQPLLDVEPPSERSALADKVFTKELAVVGLLHRAGIPIVAGTDQTVPGYSLHRELELYAQAGFTPMEAIQAATIVPARVMRLDQELGTIETGKRADLIVLAGNPLEDIHNTRKVESVITNGKLYNTADLWRSVEFKP